MPTDELELNQVLRTNTTKLNSFSVFPVGSFDNVRVALAYSNNQVETHILDINTQQSRLGMKKKTKRKTLL